MSVHKPPGLPRRAVLQGALAGLTGAAIGKLGLPDTHWSAEHFNVPIVRVTDPAFGAVGDGVTDDRAAFQAAIDTAVAQSRPLLIPPPPVAYQIDINDNHDALVIAGDLIMVGGGADNTTVQFNIETPDFERRYAGLLIENGANVTLRDLHIREVTRHPELEFYGIIFDAGTEDHHGVVARVHVEGFHHCIHVPSGGVSNVGELDLTLLECDLHPGLLYGLSFWAPAEGHKRLQMIGCTLHDNQRSHLVYCHPHNTVFVKGCRFDGATAWAWQFQGSEVGVAPEYQRFEDCWFGPRNGRGIITQSPGSVEIHNCVFKGRPAVQIRSDVVIERCVFTTAVGLEKPDTCISAYDEPPWKATIRDCVFAPYAPSSPQVDLRLPEIDVSVEACLFFNQNVSNVLLALGGSGSRFEIADCVFRNVRDGRSKVTAVRVNDGQATFRDSQFEGPFLSGRGIILCESTDAGPGPDALLQFENCIIDVAGSDTVIKAEATGVGTWDGKISGRGTYFLNLQPPHRVFLREPDDAQVVGAVEPVPGDSPQPLMGAPVLVVNSNYDTFYVAGSARIAQIHWWESDGGSNGLFNGRVHLVADQGFQLSPGGNISLPGGDVTVAAGERVALVYDPAVGIWQVAT